MQMKIPFDYGTVKIPEKLPDYSKNERLNLKFEYDILENNGIPKERFNYDFFKLIGDILYHIIVVQTPEAENESDNRENNTIQPSIQ